MCEDAALFAPLLAEQADALYAAQWGDDVSSRYRFDDPGDAVLVIFFVLLGEKIEALYKGKKNWYAGVVDQYDEDAGTYDVTYDDGEVEKGVKQENIARAPGDSELEVGARIEAKYKGKKKYYPGKIAARAGDTYDIDYDDGEKESGVARNLIREA